MKINLNTPYTEIVVPEVSKYVDSVSVINMVDNPVNRTIHVNTDTKGRVLLWSGDEYDAIGQWTDQDVLNKLNELFNP